MAEPDKEILLNLLHREQSLFIVHGENISTRAQRKATKVD
jgi:hypothetical protein